MKLQDLKRFEEVWDRIEDDKEGKFCLYNEVEELYNYQQNIINSLVSNSESQSETNKVLVNRLLNKISWLEETIKKQQEYLDGYKDTDIEQFRTLEGIVKGLKLALHNLKNN